MKHATSTLFIFFGFITLLAACLALRAAPFASDTLVHSAPDATARVTGTLAAGTVPPPVTSPLVVALPPGWQAVEHSDVQTCWVRDNDLDKELNIKPGTLLHAAPSAESPVTGTMAAGDINDLTDVKGRWTQMRHAKRTIGYIETSADDVAEKWRELPAPVKGEQDAPPTLQAAKPASGASASTISPQTLAALTQPQPRPQSQTTATATTIVTATATSTVRASAPPPAVRGFEGTFATTRRAFVTRRPYEYQLNDSTGERFAYLDLSAMPANQRAETYEGKAIIIYGTMLPMPVTKDIVIKVESLQLK